MECGGGELPGFTGLGAHARAPSGLAHGALLDPTPQSPEIGCSIPHVELHQKMGR